MQPTSSSDGERRAAPSLEKDGHTPMLEMRQRSSHTFGHTSRAPESEIPPSANRGAGFSKFRSTLTLVATVSFVWRLGPKRSVVFCCLLHQVPSSRTCRLSEILSPCILHGLRLKLMVLLTASPASRRYDNYSRHSYPHFPPARRAGC